MAQQQCRQGGVEDRTVRFLEKDGTFLAQLVGYDEDASQLPQDEIITQESNCGNTYKVGDTISGNFAFTDVCATAFDLIRDASDINCRELLMEYDTCYGDSYQFCITPLMPQIPTEGGGSGNCIYWNIQYQTRSTPNCPTASFFCGAPQQC